MALDDLNSSDLGRLDDIGDSLDWDWEGTGRLAKSACGFLIFLAIVAMILEGAIIAQRFLNFGIVEKFNLYFIIAVSSTLCRVNCGGKLLKEIKI